MKEEEIAQLLIAVVAKELTVIGLEDPLPRSLVGQALVCPVGLVQFAGGEREDVLEAADNYKLEKTPSSVLTGNHGGEIGQL